MKFIKMVKKISNKKVGIISNTVNLSKNSEETSLAIVAKRALAENVKIWHETIKRQEDEAKEARIVGEKMKNAFDELYSNILKQMDDKLDLTQMKYDELCEKYKQDGVKLQEQYEEKNRKLEETYVQRELELNANYKKLHIDLEEQYKKKNNTVVFEYNAAAPTPRCAAPSVFDFKASNPTAVIFEAVVFAVRALYPTAVFSIPVVL